MNLIIREGYVDYTKHINRRWNIPGIRRCINVIIEVRRLIISLLHSC